MVDYCGDMDHSTSVHDPQLYDDDDDDAKFVLIKYRLLSLHAFNRRSPLFVRSEPTS